MFITPLVIACSVGFLSTMYKIAEKQKLVQNGQVSVVIDGLQHSLRQPTSNENLTIFFHDWSTQFCTKEGIFLLFFLFITNIYSILFIPHSGLKLGFDSDSLHLCSESIVNSLFNRMNEIDIYKEKHIELEPWSTTNSTSTVTESVQTVETTETKHNEQVNVDQHDYIEYNEILENNDFVEQLKDHTTTNSSSASTGSSSSSNSESSINQPQLLKLPLEINDITYIFEYIATSDQIQRNNIAYQLAKSFCHLHGDSLVNQHALLTSMVAIDGESSEIFQQRRKTIATELLQEQCIDPIHGALAANMEHP